MLDPASIGIAINVCSTAFKAIQRGFEAGREMEAMHGDLQRWLGSSAEIAATEENAKNAGVITRIIKGSSNIEAMALQAMLAKKKIEEQRYNLKVYISMKYGMPAWEELLRTEGRLRKMKAEQMKEQRKFMERIVITVVLTVILALGGAGLWYFADFLKELK
jgi:hypothetical protein